MCFSQSTSVVTFLVGMLSGVAAIYLKQYVLGMLILCYAQMQLSEVLIWYGLNNNNDTFNKIGTRYGKYLLPAHNIAIGLGIYIETGEILPLIIGLLFYILIMIYYDFYCNPNEITKLPECIKNKNCDKFGGKLRWPYPHEWYIFSFILSTILAIKYVKPLSYGLFIIGIYWFFFIMTWLVDFYSAFGSYWCWIMAAAAPLIVLLGQFILKISH